MPKPMYEVNYSLLRQQLTSLKARKVLIQAPLGLKRLMHEVADFVESMGIAGIFSGGLCWGGCDIAFEEAKSIHADAIVHLGHAPFVKHHEIPTVYVECRYNDRRPLEETLEKALPALASYRRVGVGVSVQWMNFLEWIKNRLRTAGLEPRTGQPGKWVAYEGQVLGCDYTTLRSIDSQVDVHMIVGSVFHALGMALTSTKETIALDPESRRVEALSAQARKIFRQRYAMITKFMSCGRIGVLVSTKKGQKRPGVAERILELIEKNGRHGAILILNEIDSKHIEENQFDGYVNTACPRLSIEDQARFSKPVLLPSETLVALGLVKWEELLERGLLLEENPLQYFSMRG